MKYHGLAKTGLKPVAKSREKMYRLAKWTARSLDVLAALKLEIGASS